MPTSRSSVIAKHDGISPTNVPKDQTGKIKHVGVGRNSLIFKCDNLVVNNTPFIFSLPINPSGIKWNVEVDVRKNDTMAGEHYQFLKVRRTGGTMTFSTGSAIDIPFANTLISKIKGKSIGNCQNAYDYLMRVGALIEYWARKAVTDNVGPLTMIDNHFATHVVQHKILFTGFQGMGPEAAKTFYDINLSFEILEETSNYELSELNIDVMPPLGRADVFYTAKSGDTIQSLAKKYYKNADMSILFKQIARNQQFIDSKGSIKPGSQILIPYMAVGGEYNKAADQVNSGKKSPTDSKQLSKTAGDLLGAFDDFLGFL